MAVATNESKPVTNGASTKATVTTRPKNPSYHVLTFTHLTASGPVKATSRKEAIKAAGESFLVIAEKEFQVLKRKVKTVVQEIFE